MRSRLYILFVVLIVVAASVWWISGDEEETVNSEWQFAVEDKSMIDKVVLTKRQGRPLVLENKEGTWYVNDERRARKNAIDNLLNGLTNVEIKSLPAGSQYESLEKDFMRFSIKVEIYNEEGEKLKTYYVGPDTNNGEGTYYLMEGGERIFIMSMTAFTGGMRARFDLGEQDWWRRQVMDFNPSDLTSVTVSYPRQPMASFMIDKTDGEWEVRPVSEERPRITRTFLPERVENYLKEFKRKGILEFANEYRGRDSVLNIQPFAEIRVITEEKDTSGYIFIPRTDQDIQGPNSNAPEQNFQYTYWLYDPESSDLMTVQHFQFKPIFRGYEYFFSN